MSQSIPTPVRLNLLPTEVRHLIIQHLFDECFENSISLDLRVMPLVPSHSRAVRGLTAIAKASHILREDVLFIIFTREARLRKVIRAHHSSSNVEEAAHRRVVREAIYCMSLGKAIEEGRGPRIDSLPRRRINRGTLDLMSLIGLLLATVGMYIARVR